MKVIEFTSPLSPTILYACGECGYTVVPNTREAAEKHCQCSREGCTKVPKQHYVDCDEHHAEFQENRRARRQQSLSRLPTVSYAEVNGPVYVDDTDRWHANLDEAIEVLRDDGVDLAAVIIHPGNVGKVPLPDIVTYVDESWGDHYGEGYYDGLGADVVAILTDAARKIAELAPDLWTADTSKRVDMATVPVA